MAKVIMKTVWEMRRMILNGYTVKEVATETKCSEAIVRKYTKAEREKVKEKEDRAQFIRSDIEAHDVVRTVSQMNLFDVVEA